MFGRRGGEVRGEGEVKGGVDYIDPSSKVRAKDLNVMKNLLFSYQSSPSYNLSNIGGIGMDSQPTHPPLIPPTKQSSYVASLH